MHLSITEENGINLEQLKMFIDDCYERLPANTPVCVNNNVIPCVDIKADEESINFYDWI